MNQSADLQRSLFAIQEYGQLIGFEQLLDEGSQVAAFELESGATISFEALENGVIISRMQQFSPYNIFDTMIKALSMSHYRRGVNYIMQPGMLGDDRLVITIFLSQQQLVPHQFDGAVKRLDTVFNQIGN
ncbi:hypothetical protein [Pleionea sp. CnH1-48]|uniref:hypothetical protein n=1 Tax=Pleionea sp. CnH1-48 TaxID=2954494 RepID=UPI0020969046|nr:hypothetical protein [Pleionea sp. CnH1-48]MCO7226986.1 hypothetical protein [Pleionea sp. CnH1-48]